MMMKHFPGSLDGPRIQKLTAKTLIGMSLQMSLGDNRTRLLWQQFMPRRKEILHALGSERYSVQNFSDDFDPRHFKSDTPFTKWAAVEVAANTSCPVGMEKLIIPNGQYAVFHYTGPVNEAARVFTYIFYEWLPKSPYQLDNRAHFEVLGEKYSNTSPDSEEEIWIPIVTSL